MYREPSDALSVVTWICWLVFVVYWAISAIGAKQNIPGKGGFGRWLRARLVLIAIIYLLIRLPVFRQYWQVAYHLPLFHNEAVRLAGLMLTLAGIAFAVWARVHLGRNWSGQPSIKVGHELITSGPYSFVRHPIYTGILTALFGTGLVLGPFCLLIFAAAVIVFIWRIRVEEGYMMELFPEVYPAYRKRTKALIPWLC